MVMRTQTLAMTALGLASGALAAIPSVSIPLHYYYGGGHKIATNLISPGSDTPVEVVVDQGSENFWVFGPGAVTNWGCNAWGNPSQLRRLAARHSRLDLDVKVHRPQVEPPVLLQLVRGVRHRKVHLLDELGHDDHVPEPGVVLADALAFAVAVGPPHAHRQLLVLVAHHPLGLERQRVLEHGRVAVHPGQHEDHGLVVGDLVLAPREQHGALVAAFPGDGLDVEARRGEGQPQALAHDALDVLELREVAVRQLAAGSADDAVELRPRRGDDVRVLEQEVDDGADEARRRAAADGHGHDLVNDLRVGQGLARLGVRRTDEGGQEVLAVRRVVPAVLDHVRRVGPHGRRGPFELAAEDEPVEEPGPVRPLYRLGRRVLHTLEHRVRRPREAVELLAKERQRRRLEVQPVELPEGGHGLVRAEAAPLGQQLVGRAEHVVEPLRHRLGRQLGRDDAVRHAPARLVLKRREERVVHGVPDLDDRPAHVLAEPLLVAQLLGERGARHEDDGLAEHLDLEDLAVLLRQLLEGGPRVLGVHVEYVA
ncbi:hypothetical protein CTA2_6715 [Colletotrichum tanaceti]|uniref:Peptidase A1 domain-containing protein n=1 Tax=Colletotrichum tanaceti TaxID=1306861 RepID=A0A4U6X686_9PEZI|nr:hypothetical protein CTA2_6715 [Colletotrichum tanaceti]TKW50962.1 hypothetical protein CTA1_2688 [Colletotrichum tanaceti]